VVEQSPAVQQSPTAEQSPTVEQSPTAEPGAPRLVIYCLGRFRVYQDDVLIADWPSGRGKAILKYMIAEQGRPIPKEVLMDLFWPDASPEAARNNLNVALYGLREAFRATRPAFPHLLFEDDHYRLNPAMSIWVDADEFLRHYKAGQAYEQEGRLAQAMQAYETAEDLYRGDFMAEDRYEDWPIPQREGLKDNYFLLLERLSRYHLEQRAYPMCIRLCQKILAKDDCREDAHRRLMQCYYQQGQRHLALRQYDLCVEALEQVLDVPPMPETVTLYRQIRNGAAA
jgi:DNA-binding SARP family transcriptional activator